MPVYGITRIRRLKGNIWAVRGDRGAQNRSRFPDTRAGILTNRLVYFEKERGQIDRKLVKKKQFSMLNDARCYKYCTTLCAYIAVDN